MLYFTLLVAELVQEEAISVDLGIGRLLTENGKKCASEYQRKLFYKMYGIGSQLAGRLMEESNTQKVQKRNYDGKRAKYTHLDKDTSYNAWTMSLIEKTT